MAQCSFYGVLTMTISMYQASVPRFASMLRNLDAILGKAQAHALARKIDPAVLLTAYNILRHNGLEIGKRDYIGSP